MGQKGSTSVGDGVLMKDNDGLPKQDTTSVRANEDEEQRGKYPVLCPAYREIILECYEKSHGDTASRIVMRMGQQRDDFRAFMDSVSPEERDILIENLRNYLNAVVRNIDDSEEVKELSANFGAFHVRWRASGFKPDFFAITADAIATECVFLGGTATATAPTSTFKAWTLLVGMMFSAVRDGYYAELRRYRKSPAFTSDSVESIPSTEHCSEATTYQDGSSRMPNSCESDSRQGSDARFVGTSPARPRIMHRERGSGSPRLQCDGRSPNGSRQSLNETRPSTTSLHREDAFYIRKLPQPYQRSRSAIINNTTATSPNEPVDRMMQRENIRKMTAGSPRETASTGASSLSGSSSSMAGRYQKNVILDSDMKRGHHIDEFVRRHAMHKFMNENRKSASATNLFNPNKIIDDFMNDRL